MGGGGVGQIASGPSASIRKARRVLRRYNRIRLLERWLSSRGLESSNRAMSDPELLERGGIGLSQDAQPFRNE